jgi:PBP1b-binding outer membrane lipoprotein LpoB
MRKLLLIVAPLAVILAGCSATSETSSTSTPEPAKTDTPKTDNAPTPGPVQTASLVTCDECKKEVDAKDIVAHGSAKICKACEAHHNH